MIRLRMRRLMMMARGNISNPDPLTTFQVFGDLHVGAISQTRLDAMTNDKPIAPLALVGAGDITQDGTALQDTPAIAWLDGMHSDWYVINGGHDVKTRTPAQFAAAYGMAGQNWVVDLGVCTLIGFGPDDASTVTASQVQIDFLDAQLTAAGASPCVIIAHWPLFYSHINTNTTDFYSSDVSPWYTLPDGPLRTILAKHANAKAWVSGHLHLPPSTTDFVKNEIIGDHRMALIAASSPYYTNKTIGEAATEGIYSQYISVYADKIEVRTRNHLTRQWVKLYTIPLDTSVAYPSPSFSMTFSSDQANPIPMYSPADIGILWVPAPKTVVAISGGQLVASGTPSGQEDHRPVTVMYRKCGRAFRVDVPVHATVPNNGLRIGLMEGTSYYGAFFYGSATGIEPKNTSAAKIYTEAMGANAHKYIFVMRDTGSFLFGRDDGDAAGQYRLLYVYNTGSMALMVRVMIDAQAVDLAIDNMLIEDWFGEYATQYGLATARVAVTANDETMAATAEGIFEHTITAATGVTQEFMFRRQDDDNTWIVRMDQAGSTVKLISKAAGVETEQASAAQTWTDGTQYRIVVRARLNMINVMVADVFKAYKASSALIANTGLKVSHAGADLVAWPISITP